MTTPSMEEKLRTLLAGFDPGAGAAWAIRGLLSKREHDACLRLLGDVSDRALALAVVLVAPSNPQAEFDAGSAWMALNAKAKTLGFELCALRDVQGVKIAEVLGVSPSALVVKMGIAIGKLGTLGLQPPPAPIAETALTARFPD